MAADSVFRPFLSAAEVGELLGLSASQVCDRAQAGIIPGTRNGPNGRRWTFRRSQIEALASGQPGTQLDALVAAIQANTEQMARLCESIESRIQFLVAVPQRG